MPEKKRVTIMLDTRIEKKIRNRQAKQITDTQGSVSFSKVANEDLAKYYKIQQFEYHLNRRYCLELYC